MMIHWVNSLSWAGKGSDLRLVEFMVCALFVGGVPESTSSSQVTRPYLGDTQNQLHSQLGSQQFLWRSHLIPHHRACMVGQLLIKSQISLLCSVVPGEFWIAPGPCTIAGELGLGRPPYSTLWEISNFPLEAPL